jgi:two-component system, cell cycle sensor histidine kinase and response regulator CckA
MMDTTVLDGVNVHPPLLRVLIVEDNPRDAKLTAKVLEGEVGKVQFEVTDSLESFRENLETARYDVIVADFNLHNWTALDALEILKESGKDIPLIVVTGSLGDEAAVECIKQGAADFVLKDRPARLPTAVQRALKERRLREERKRATQELSESEERYRTLFERNLAGVFRTAWDGRILECNQAMANILGISNPREVLNLRVQDLYFSAEDRARFLEKLEAEGRLTNFEMRLRRKDGSPAWLIGNISLLPQPGTGHSIIEGTLVDITERKLTEAENARLALIVNSSDDAIFSTTLEGIIATWNAGAERMYGYAPEEIKGKHFSLLIPEESRGELAANQERLHRGEPLVHYEAEHVRKDRSRLQTSLTLSPIKDAAGEVSGVSVISRDITQSKQAEVSLRESEERFRATFENAGVGMALVDMQGHPFKSNPVLQQMLGYSEDELTRMVFTEYTHPDDRELDWKLYRELTAGIREKYEIEKRFCTKSGGVVWGQLTVSLVKDMRGRPLCAIGMVQDITERKRADKAVLESEERFRTLFENAPVGIYRTTPNGRILAGNPAIIRMLGYSSFEDLAARDLNDTGFEPEYSRRQFMERLEREGEVSGLESAWYRQEGEVLYVRENARAIRDESGKTLYYEGTVEDITERKKAEAERARLVTAIEQSAEAVVITNLAGDIEYVNPAFTRITGYGREEVLGENPRLLKSGEQAPAFYQQLWATISKGQIWHGELINQRKDGSTYTEQLNIAPVRGARGEITHYIATMQDVSERKSLEEQVRQATKMEAVGRLAGGVAHDFNNLLTIINGYSELLMDKFESDKEAGAFLKEVKDAGERAASLTRQLLAFSRRQVLAPQVLDLNFVVSDMEKMLKRLIGEDIHLHTLLAPSLQTVKADPGQIEQVIMNLAVNARDAMPHGGNLTIQTQNVELDEDYARSHVTVKPGPHVMLAVSDTGSGMTPETQARIFEPFFTTKEKGKGTGLGLATVYGIVKQSGGSIWVYSELGHGTVFKVFLPAVGEEPMAKEPAVKVPKTVSASETVLVVEDEAGVRSLIRLALESAGYAVLETEDPESALVACTNHDGPIHLLLTDVVMPNMSGPVVAEKVANLRPGIKVLFMSGYTDDAVVRHGVLSSNKPFIQKPFSPAELRQKIREVLGEK